MEFSTLTKRNTIPHFHPATRLKPSGRIRACSGKNVAVHVSYTTHIASLHYIENFSTYVVSRRHLHIAYFTTSLQEHREVKRSRSTKNHRRFLERSNEVMEFSIINSTSKGQGQTSFSREMCLGTLKFHTYRRFSHFSHTYFYLILSILPGYRKKRRKSASSANCQGKL